jgi:nucleolar protein 58
MNAIAPNLTALVGELVGARLISHAGSLMNLSKQPASTIQILGAEKALFRALKTKHNTPKYGLIYHASLVGQAGPKNKAKVARMLAAKTALSLRVDALGESESNDIGIDGRTKVEARINMLEGRVAAKANKDTSIQNQSKFKFNKAQQYSEGADVVMAEQEEEAPKKRKIEEVEEAEESEEKKSKKEKKEKKDKKEKKEKKEKKDKKEKKEKKDKKSKKSKD